jgi:ABC-type transport system involved in cytochrome c biogenesis permease subunit
MSDQVRQFVKPLASLKLTVVLLSLSMFLILAGTYAQIDLGIWTILTQYFRTWYVFIPFQIFVSRQWHVPGGLPFPGGYFIGGMLLINLLAAHVVRFKWGPKRIGVILIHVSLIMLLLGELVTALYAAEANMTIEEGKTVNFTEDIHAMELAVIDPSPAEHDEVITVPQSQLKSGALISDAKLPFQIRIDQYFDNSHLLGPFQAQSEGQAGRRLSPTQGIASQQQLIAEELPPVSGVEANRIDTPSALISLYDNGQDLGSWLVSLHLKSQTVQVGDKSYHIALRFTRHYKPYSLHLIDFRFDRYLGTNTPRNYSSQVRLIDPSRNEDRQVLIYMNHPLRYRGETFFQASFNSETERSTTLQVVRNPGWLVPYIACGLGALGMLIHFIMQLVRFLNRSRVILPGTSIRNSIKLRMLPVGAAVMLGVALVPSLQWWAQGLEGDAISTFGKLPVVDSGRVKPIDTLARMSLMVISGKQAWYTDGSKGSGDRKDMIAPQPATATQWLMDVLARPQQADDYTVFRIDHPEVLALMNQQPEQRKYFSYHEIMAYAEALDKQMQTAGGIAAKDRTSFQTKLVDLVDHVTVYRNLRKIGGMFLVPPTKPGDAWQELARAHQAAQAQGKVDSYVDSFSASIAAWGAQNTADLSKALEDHDALLAQQVPQVVHDVRFEAFFNRATPFYYALAIYVVVAVLIVGSWLFMWKPLNTTAFWLLMINLVIHTFGILARMDIQDRPPVTNLYSSAIFVGWGAVLLGACIERIYRNGLGAATASVIGFVTLIIAHNLALDGDTMTMMQAVLDTNFWLATHVVVVTLGYSATFLAGVLGMVLIVMGVMADPRQAQSRKTLARMIYGTVCFAALFSFVGTILGGLWADQSWGRFWGWDPKENGAMLIVLWNALVLHSRWGGLVRERGIAMLAVGGNAVTAWSWFGTNMLGTGLHAYGFMESGVFWLYSWYAVQVIFLAVAWVGAARQRRRGALKTG